jgi:hypothetical protein
MGPFVEPLSQTDNRLNWEEAEYTSILSMIDAGTRWVELAPLKTVTAEEIISKFKDFWLTRYPRPTVVVSDQGTQFLSGEFQSTLTSVGIKHRSTTTYNPQANGLVERIHQFIGNAIRIRQVADWDKHLQEIAWTLRGTFHRILGCAPSHLVFGKDLVASHITYDIPSLLTTVKKQHETLQEESLLQQNRGRVAHQFKIGGLVFRKVENPTKLQTRFTGPHEILKVHNNNTLTLKITPDQGHPYLVRVNIRKVKPFSGGQHVVNDQTEN